MYVFEIFLSPLVVSIHINPPIWGGRFYAATINCRSMGVEIGRLPALFLLQSRLFARSKHSVSAVFLFTAAGALQELY